MKNKSAKDLAFEKERAKFRKEINLLQENISERNKEIIDLNIRILQLEGERDQLQDWVNRLLEYTGMSKEDLQSMIESEKRKAELMENVAPLFGFMGKYL